MGGKAGETTKTKERVPGDRKTSLGWTKAVADATHGCAALRARGRAPAAHRAAQSRTEVLRRARLFAEEKPVRSTSSCAPTFAALEWVLYPAGPRARPSRLRLIRSSPRSAVSG